jgi:hypothetical protein
MGTNEISTDIDGDEKDESTVLATVCASGFKSPLYFLVTGKIARVETSQLGTKGHTGRITAPRVGKPTKLFKDTVSHIRW